MSITTTPFASTSLSFTTTTPITTRAASSLTTPATTPNNLFTGVSTSTLLSTQTAIPTERRPFGCGGGFQNLDTVNPACALQAYDFTAALMLKCCNGAPRVVYASNCNIYCNAQGQTLQQLNNCLSDGINGTRPAGGILCNRSGASFTSLLPEETDSRSFTNSYTSTPTSTGTAAATASTAAAAAGLSTGLRDGVGGVSIAAWCTVVLLAVSGVAGMLL